MTCRPEAGRRLAVIAATLALLLTATGPGRAQPSADPLAPAIEQLGVGDGIAAEVTLRRALDAGVPREAVAAYMGEALLLQDKPERARAWLEPGSFTTDSAARGFRALAQLEQGEGDLPAAGAALDEALRITPRDATMWVEIGRLRYAGGEHRLALAAAARALELDAKNVRAIEFQGQLVRDREGFAAALPWFERALKEAPEDISVLSDYAATLGDMGRTREMLAVTRRMLAIEPGEPFAFYLQAVLAARAGKTDLARGLMARTRDTFKDMPAAMLLDGVLHIRGGNYLLAADSLQKLLRMQPGNAKARTLLARALYLAGEYRLVVSDNAAAVQRADASPYLLTLVARAHEAMGRRDLAAPLLNRAATAELPVLSPVAQGSEVGALLASGDIAAAQARTSSELAKNPDSADLRILAGDVALFAGDPRTAIDHYQRAATVRLPESLMLRMREAWRQLGDIEQGEALAARFLAQHPQSRAAKRIATQARAR